MERQKMAIHRFILLASTCVILPLFTLAAQHAPLPPHFPQAYHLSSQQIDTYRRDGVIIIRRLLQGEELNNAIRAAKRVQRSPSLAQLVFSFIFPSSYRSLEFQTWRKHKALEKVAFDSAASTISAKLMGLDGKNRAGRSVRLLKDAVLGYKAGDTGCGWHVDDKFFWPCEDRNIGQRDAGVNVWITLSPVSIKEGGGLAVAPGSHTARFARKAREVIAKRGGITTCFLESLAPDLHEKIEKLKMVYDLEPGDAIIHDRYMFHRANAFTDPVEGKKAGVKLRISLRYVPDDATFFNNTVDRAIEVKNLSTGDLISKGGEYYPQTWPNSLTEERNKKVMTEQPPYSMKTLFKFLLVAMKNKNN